MNPARLRIRRLLEVAPADLSGLMGNYWALSRPHMGEEVDRWYFRVRDAHRHGGLTSMPRELHMHKPRKDLDPAATPFCTQECLYLDEADADEPMDEGELERTKIATTL